MVSRTNAAIICALIAIFSVHLFHFDATTIAICERVVRRLNVVVDTRKWSNIHLK
jgi:hypothetical protein